MIVKMLGKKKFFIVGVELHLPEMAKVCKILMSRTAPRTWPTASGTGPFGVGLDGQQDQELRLRRGAVQRGRPLVVAFYREFKNQGLTHDKLPICASAIPPRSRSPRWTGIRRRKLRQSFPYFMAIDTDRNKAFGPTLPQIRQGPEGGDAPCAGIA